MIHAIPVALSVLYRLGFWLIGLVAGACAVWVAALGLLAAARPVGRPSTTRLQAASQSAAVAR